MQKHTVSFDLWVFESLEKLSEEDLDLMGIAEKARINAYAPYSNFQVGAAILLENGEVVIGSNQENASYPCGLCAERVAIFQAGAKFPGIAIEKIAVTATAINNATAKPAAPCGSCRQSIYEYQKKQEKPIQILFMGAVGEVYKCNSITDLLPLAFGNEFLTLK